MLALMLTELPLPELFEWGRPQWAVLVLIYWVAALPHRVGPWYGWWVGLLLDILQGSLLGIHALALALVAAIVKALHQRFRMFPVWQQGLLVLVLVGLYQLLLNWGQQLQGSADRFAAVPAAIADQRAVLALCFCTVAQCPAHPVGELRR